MMLTIGLFTTHLFCSVCNDGAFDKNKLIAIETETHAIATMVNSYGNRSFMLARKTPPYKNFGVYFGIATGYDEQYGALVPVVSPYYEFGRFKVTAFSEALALSYSVEF